MYQDSVLDSIFKQLNIILFKNIAKNFQQKFALERKTKTTQK